MYPKNETEKQMNLIPYRFYPKFRPRYRQVYHSRFQPMFKQHAHSLFQPRWDALIEMRRRQRHKYTFEEKQKLEPVLVKRWLQRHRVYTQEEKEHEEALKTMKSAVPSRYHPRYHSSFRSVYRSVYRPIPKRKLTSKCKYRCTECEKGFLWLNDFLSHIKMEHKGKHPLGLPRIHN